MVLEAWEAGRRLSAVGPGPLEAHFEHATALSHRIPAEARSGLDLGCGAGIPGLALAGLRDEMTWVLLDASLRRIRLVRQTIQALGWGDRVVAQHGRAEDRNLGLAPVDVVVTRLFGPPPVAAECAAPLVRKGGTVLISDSVAVDDAAVADRWPSAGLEPLGLVPAGRYDEPAVQVLRRSGDIEPRFPRKPGVATKRPLWQCST